MVRGYSQQYRLLSEVLQHGSLTRNADQVRILLQNLGLYLSTRFSTLTCGNFVLLFLRRNKNDGSRYFVLIVRVHQWRVFNCLWDRDFVTNEIDVHCLF